MRGMRRDRMDRPAGTGAGGQPRAGARSDDPYQITSMMEGVVKRGTAMVVQEVGQADRRQDRHHQRREGCLGSWASRPTSWWVCSSATTSRGRWAKGRPAACWRHRSSPSSCRWRWRMRRPRSSRRRPAWSYSSTGRPGLRAQGNEGVILEALKPRHLAAIELLDHRLARTTTGHSTNP